MNVLAIGSDRSVLDASSQSAKRQIAYGQHFDALNIIVFKLGKGSAPAVVLSDKVRVVATCSRSRLFYGLDAIRIARTLQKPDIVSAQDPFEAGLVAWFIARMLGAKLHVQVHTDFHSPYFTGAVNLIRRGLARFVLGRADRIRVVSDRIKESLEERSSKSAPITVLPIFVDVARFHSAHAGILAGRFAAFSTRLLVVARLEKEKNIGLAIDAFAKAAPHDSCLIIVGDGGERRKLSMGVARLGMAGRVFFEGESNPLPYYAVADLLLVPSLYEGYGLVIIEALAAGKPVLSTDVGVAREAGALVAETRHFTEALAAWFENGPRIGVLQQYPYQTFDEYVAKYTTDIANTVA